MMPKLLLCLSLGTLAQATYAQMSWTLASAVGPSGSTHLVYDGQNGKVLLFEGVSGNTWEWDGGAWTLAATSGPSPRGAYALAYDAFRGRVVLFGGSNTAWLGDTWEWDGASWQLRATTGPPPLSYSSMAFDSARHRTVLFGGNDGATYRGETWEWDGASWMLASSIGPPPRAFGFVQPGLAYDAARSRCVLFGGVGVVGDTWEWDGASWTLAAPANANYGSIIGSMSYDQRRQRVVRYSTLTVSPLNTEVRLFEWDGASWSSSLVVGAPSGMPIAYDVHRDRIVAYFGNNTETWEGRAPAPSSFVPFGQGCSGPAGIPVLSALPSSLPTIGRTFQLQLTNLPTSVFAIPVAAIGFSDQQFNGMALPLPLDSLGAPACSLFVSMDQEFVLTNQSGGAAWNIPVPPDSLLVGVNAYLQGGVLLPGGSGIAVSNAGHAIVGSL